MGSSCGPTVLGFFCCFLYWRKRTSSWGHCSTFSAVVKQKRPRPWEKSHVTFYTRDLRSPKIPLHLKNAKLYLSQSCATLNCETPREREEGQTKITAITISSSVFLVCRLKHLISHSTAEEGEHTFWADQNNITHFTLGWVFWVFNAGYFTTFVQYPIHIEYYVLCKALLCQCFPWQAWNFWLNVQCNCKKETGESRRKLLRKWVQSPVILLSPNPSGWNYVLQENSLVHFPVKVLGSYLVTFPIRTKTKRPSNSPD